MSAADGVVLGLHKITDAGPVSTCWNLVIVADGYTQPQMPRFAADAAAVKDRLLEIAPFSSNSIRRVINVFRLDVASREQGADRPNCADGAGTGQAVATYFDSRFCSDGKTQRLLYGNAVLAAQTVGAVLREWHQIIVLVNDQERGGAGGKVAWFSNGGDDWREVAVHELGHSAFNLADEYGYGGPTQWPGGEPGQPNISAVADPARVKWRSHVNARPQIPSRRNPDCAHTDPGPSGFPAGTIGTFEGAGYSNCGIYRPAWDCLMRNTSTSAPFCAVCSEVIVQMMAQFPGAPRGIRSVLRRWARARE